MQLCCTPRRWQPLSALLAVVAIVAILIILFVFTYPKFARSRLIEQIVFRNGSESMSRFETTADAVNLRLEIYLYTVTNPNQVIKGAKMEFKELGPFVYHEYKNKEILDNNQTSGLITYKLQKRFNFIPHLSGGGDPTKVKVMWPNIPMIVTKSYINQLNSSIEISLANLAMEYFFTHFERRGEREQAFISDTVENFLFDGSYRKILAYLEKMNKIFKLFKPWPIPGNKFGVFYGKNNSDYPFPKYTYTVSAGFGGNQTSQDLNQYKLINGSSKLKYWKPEPSSCNEVIGSDGQFFAPFLDHSQDLEVYSNDICRKILFKPKTTLDFKGVPVIQYAMDSKSFDSPKTYDANKCYCLGDINKVCSVDGLVDLSTCLNQPNIMASGSRFLFGDDLHGDERVANISKPSLDLDLPTLFVEPNTGLTVKEHVPLQFNVRLEKGTFSLFNWFKDDKPLIIPLLRLVESAEMTDDQAATLRTKLMLLDSWLVSMVLAGAIILILAIVTGAMILIVRYRNMQRTRPSQIENQNYGSTAPRESTTQSLTPP